MSTLSTHVLDAVTGTPAEGMPVRLEQRTGTDGWTALAEGATDADGRIRGLGPAALEPAVYRLTFDTDAWSSGAGSSAAGTAGAPAFYPEVSIVFRVTEERHYHVPLLLSPFAYSTYRGS